MQHPIVCLESRFTYNYTIKALSGSRLSIFDALSYPNDFRWTSGVVSNPFSGLLFRSRRRRYLLSHVPHVAGASARGPLQSHLLAHLMQGQQQANRQLPYRNAVASKTTKFHDRTTSTPSLCCRHYFATAQNTNRKE